VRNLRRLATAMVVSGVVTAGMAMVFAGPASAHHPDITVATGECRDGVPTIVITSTAWPNADPARRVNPSIGITIDGVQVATGAFAAPDYSFTRIVPTTAGPHVVRATALAAWGPDGEFGNVGEYSEVSVVVAPCPEGSTTTASTTTASTTTASSTTATPPSAEVVVKGTVVSTSSTAPAPTAASQPAPSTTVAKKQLPVTGSNTSGVLTLALSLVFGGAALLGVERRLRVTRGR